MLVLSGEGKAVIEEDGVLKEHLVKAHDIWFVPIKVIHKIENIGKTDLNVIEMLNLPHDFVVAE